jgi:hypothetical protein
MTTPVPENCVPLLKQAAELGLKIEVKDSKTLTVEPAERCPPEFADELRRHKWHLLHLLDLSFVMLYSKALDETIFFAEDDDTKAALIEAGADCWSIYTKDELRVLVANNRAKPYLPDELCKLHEIKKTFNGRISK